MQSKIDRMPKESVKILRDLCAQSPRREICGFVMKNWDIVPCDNVSPFARKMFEIDPAFQLELVKTQRNNILGIYHSHPGQNPRPSITDVNGWPSFPNARYWTVVNRGVFEWRKDDESGLVLPV